MKKLKSLLRPMAMVLAAFVVVAVLGFVEHSADRTPVKDLQVTLDAEQGIHFIDENAVREQVLGNASGVLGSAVADIDMVGIEQRLRNIGCVSSANVYRTVDGTLHVRVKQREPIVRVINADGSSFYIDKEGWTMPLSDNYTARVLVVTGELFEPFAKTGVTNVINSTDSIFLRTRSREIFNMARTLNTDPLWSALFEQATVDLDGNFELIPRIGVQRVRVGNGVDLAHRLEKLRTFYKQGVAQTDWRRYSAIDLRFADQVVCTRRDNISRAGNSPAPTTR